MPGRFSVAKPLVPYRHQIQRFCKTCGRAFFVPSKHTRRTNCEECVPSPGPRLASWLNEPKPLTRQTDYNWSERIIAKLTSKTKQLRQEIRETQVKVYTRAEILQLYPDGRC